MKLLKWFRQLFSPETENIDPFADIKKEKTSEIVVKPVKKPRKTTKKKSTGGKKDG